MDRVDRSFDDLVRARTGPHFIERRWLHERIEQAHGSHVLVTGEPGAGKTSLLAGLARAHPDWLRYFARRDSRTALAGGDVQSFLLEIGHQLARRRPGLFEPQRLEVVVRQHIDTVLPDGSVVGIRIEDLSVSPFHRTASLYVDQQLGEVAGTVRGIEIGSAGLEPRLLEPANLAHLALIGPAEVLLAEDPAARIVILLDALDEFADGSASTSLLRWLAQGPELPPNVTLVMTSRPHAALAPLRHRTAELSIDPDSAQVTGDLLAYATRVLATAPLRAAAEAAGLYPDVLHRDVVRHAAGNFLYLSTYARALAGAVGAADGPLTARLLDLAELPHGLTGLYAFFIDTARSDLGSLGMLDVREPTGPADHLTPAWEGAGQPLLGVLAVAREPLTVEQLTVLAGLRVWPRAVRNLLTRLRWLLDERDGRIALYHTSIGEFLTADRTYRTHPDSWVDALEWHERIVRHYRGDAATWAEVPWNDMDRYGLLHVADHALCAGDEIAAEAVGGIACPGLLRAHRQTFGNHRHFQRLTALLADHAVDRLAPEAALPTLLHLGVVRRQLLVISRTVAPPVLGLLARLGRTDEALEHVAAMEPSYQQFRGALAIREHLPPGDGAPDRRDLLELLIQVAFTIPATTDRYGRVWRSTAPFRQAAVLLAPYDLDRALRLWQHAWDIECDDRGADAPEFLKPPDAVYSAAAAAEEDTARAAALIGLIGADAAGTLPSHVGTANDRPSAYLDLAARAAATEVPGLLRLAEQALASARQTTRLLALGRLAAAWAPYDLTEAERILTALRDESGPEHLTSFGFAGGLVDAVAEIAGPFPATARHLLERILRDPVNEETSRVRLHLARLMAAYGDTERARDLIDSVQVLWYEGARASAALATFDRDGALRLLERAYDRLPPADDPDQHSLRQAHLRNVVLEMIEHDRHRAARLARELTDVTWGGFEYDRYSTLVRIAHASLDHGDSEHAQELLAECLHAVETPPPLAGGKPFGFYRPATGAPAMPIGETYLRALSANYNSSHEWAARANSYFHRNPADVLRAVSLGPYNWGRTARILAEALADRDRDLPRAVAVVDGLTDQDEHTIGLAGLLRCAALGERPEAQALSLRLDEALAALPAYEWLAPGDHDDKAWAYGRPDHRVRFEAAVRIAPFRPEAAKLVEGTPFLSLILQLTHTTWASQTYADGVLGRGRHLPEAQAVHEQTIGPAWLPDNHHLLIDLTRAAAAFHEHRAAAGRPARPRPAQPPMVLQQSIYAAAAEAVTPAGCQSPTPAACARIRDLLTEGLVVAAAQLTAFAAEVHPDAGGQLRSLAAEVIAATARTTPMTRVDALARLALSPALADLVDPADVLRETTRPGVRTTGQPWVHGQVRLLLFPALLTRSPAVALRQFHDALADSWEDAMALLEHAADEILDALGPDAVTILHTAIRRALSCTSPDGAAPESVDGLRLATR
ncbi:AAA family ATPase [Streptomyces sp. NPDC059552]|uniref:AAA family ATPase n=1 Tax=Streptomyces sp. NPDC059552 TaxID=3346862 RepID=UPI0036CCE9CA